MKPRVVVRRYYWITKATQERSPGIGLLNPQSGKLTAHLTAPQARALADKLHDLADTLEGEEHGTAQALP